MSEKNPLAALFKRPVKTIEIETEDGEAVKVHIRGLTEGELAKATRGKAHMEDCEFLAMSICNEDGTKTLYDPLTAKAMPTAYSVPIKKAAMDLNGLGAEKDPTDAAEKNS